MDCPSLDEVLDAVAGARRSPCTLANVTEVRCAVERVRDPLPVRVKHVGGDVLLGVPAQRDRGGGLRDEPQLEVGGSGGDRHHKHPREPPPPATAARSRRDSPEA